MVMWRDGVRWYRSQDEIDTYRRATLTVENLLSALGNGPGALLFPVETGVGKTTLIDALVERQLAAGTLYDLIIYLTSRRDILVERPWMPKTGDASDDVAILVGRPRARCGELDEQWVRLEKIGCGMVGRKTLCAGCPARSECAWPEQMTSEALRGKRVIAGVQSYLSAVPGFVALVAGRAHASKVLVIIDEAFIVDAEQRARLDQRSLLQSERVFARVAAERTSLAEEMQLWLALHAALRDLGDPLETLPSLPWLDGDTAEALQETGLAMYGDRFKFLGFDLLALAYSRRWREGNDIVYVRRPRLGGAHYIVAAAHLPLELARHRLGDPDLVEFNPGDRFLHEGTRFYNLRSSLGALRNFDKNAPQIIFTFAQLIARLHAEGKRTLCVIKKSLASLAASRLERDLRALTGVPFRAIVNATVKDISDPFVVPVVTYGVQGLNCYSGFDAAIALSSFNARADIIDQRLNEAHAPGEEVPIVFATERGRRRARPQRYFDQRAGFAPLVDGYAQQYEANVVIQALGRVRFATQPRMVISFQKTKPDYPLEKEFHRLEDIRRHFGLLTRRQWAAAAAAKEVLALAAAGVSAKDIVATTGLASTTVYRILGADDFPTNPKENISLLGFAGKPGHLDAGGT